MPEGIVGQAPFPVNGNQVNWSNSKQFYQIFEWNVGKSDKVSAKLMKLKGNNLHLVSFCGVYITCVVVWLYLLDHIVDHFQREYVASKEWRNIEEWRIRKISIQNFNIAIR